MADGWVVAGLSPKRLAPARRIMDQAARDSGRDPAAITLYFQTWLA
jgi:alkanesulfonate monooxygenase SsuD/methylene tetrahydromethanopterin reductase-like flavin-dependent oxidoreductase (luciferase family)